MESVKYPHITVKMVGEDGNAYLILGRVMNALSRAGVPKEEVDAFKKEATSGDYQHLLRTVVKWVDAE